MEIKCYKSTIRIRFNLVGRGALDVRMLDIPVTDPLPNNSDNQGKNIVFCYTKTYMLRILTV